MFPILSHRRRFVDFLHVILSEAFIIFQIQLLLYTDCELSHRITVKCEFCFLPSNDAIISLENTRAVQTKRAKQTNKKQ